MSRGSAFARVIGLTKSLSPLSFDRGPPSGDDDADDVVASAATGELTGTPEGRGEIVAGTAAWSPDPMNRGPGPMPASIVVAFPAMTQVTVVAADAAPLLDAAVPSTAPAVAQTEREAVTADAINAIEADIASLLATIDRSDSADQQDDGDERPAEADEGPEPTATLLSELNRLWEDDPEISPNRLH